MRTCTLRNCRWVGHLIYGRQPSAIQLPCTPYAVRTYEVLGLVRFLDRSTMSHFACATCYASYAPRDLGRAIQGCLIYQHTANSNASSDNLTIALFRSVLMRVIL